MLANVRVRVLQALARHTAVHSAPARPVNAAWRQCFSTATTTATSQLLLHQRHVRLCAHLSSLHAKPATTTATATTTTTATITATRRFSSTTQSIDNTKQPELHPCSPAARHAIEAACATASITTATEHLIHTSKEDGTDAVDLVAAATLVADCVAGGHLEAALHVLLVAIAAAGDAGVVVRAAAAPLYEALVRPGDPELVTAILETVTSAAWVNSVPTTAGCGPLSTLLQLLTGAALRMGDASSALALHQRFDAVLGLPHPVKYYNRLLRSVSLQAGFSLIEEMLARGVNPNARSFMPLLVACVRAQDTDSALAVYTIAKDTAGLASLLSPTGVQVIVAPLVSFLGRMRSVASVRSVLDDIAREPPAPHLATVMDAIVRACIECKNGAALLHVVQSLFDHGHAVSMPTLSVVAAARRAAREAEAAGLAGTKKRRKGLFLTDEEWRLVLVQLVSAAGHPESVADYVRVMNALVESSNLKGVFTVFDKLEEVAEPPPAAFDLLIRACYYHKQSNRANMVYQFLQEGGQELSTTGMELLIATNAAANDFEAMETLLKAHADAGHALTPAMHKTRFEYYAEAHDVETARQVLADAQREGCLRHTLLASDGGTWTVDVVDLAPSAATIILHDAMADLRDALEGGFINAVPKYLDVRMRPKDTLHVESVLDSMDPPLDGITKQPDSGVATLRVTHEELMAWLTEPTGQDQEQAKWY